MTNKPRKPQIHSVSVGDKYGKWTVTGPNKMGKQTSMTPCRCECGTERLVIPADLRMGRSKNCGCVRRATVAKNNYIHGHSSTREHVVWLGMIARCTNKRHSHYAIYGGKGVVVCKRWMDSFTDFIADMGWPPSNKHSIDRIDNEGNYEPGNCRWATAKQQQRNKTKTVKITKDGVTKSVMEWSEITGIKYGTIMGRIKRGWPKDTLLDPRIRTPSESGQVGANGMKRKAALRRNTHLNQQSS